MAQLFSLPYRAAFDANNRTVPGAKAWFTTTGTDIGTPVYTSDALTTPHPNPLIANGVGRFPVAYLDPAVTYRLRIYASSATVGVSTPIESYDPYVSGVLADALSLEPVAEAAADSAAAASTSAGEAAASADSAQDNADSAAASAVLSATGAIDGAATLAAITAAVALTGFTIDELAGSGLPINPRWFGVVPSNTAAQNTTAWTAMRAFLLARANYSGAYATLPLIRFPDDETYLFNTIDIYDGAMRIEGVGPPTDTAGTTLQFAAGQTGIRVQRYDTNGASATTGSGVGGDQSVIRSLRLIGGYAGTEGEYHAVHVRGHAVAVEDCYIKGWQGDGVHIEAEVGNGNANCFSVRRTIINGCRDGLSITGGNANAGFSDENDFSSNRRWGLKDSSFLGNSHTGIVENCGVTVGSTPTMVSYSGNRYAVVAGQEGTALANAPSGTTADNAWWYYVQAGAADTVTANIPTFAAATTVRAGGSIRTTSNSAQTLLDFYTEPGQGPAQLAWPTLVIGARQFAGVKGVSYLAHDDSGVRVYGTLSVGTGVGATVNITSDALKINGAKTIQFQDSPLTANWFMQNITGYLYVLDGGGDVKARFASDGIHTPMSILSSGGAIGYETGAGGTVTQATNKSTGVTLSKVSGQITMHNAALAAGAVVSFTLTNTKIAAGDVLILNHLSGGTAGAYALNAQCAAGSASISVRNLTAGSLGEAIVIAFAIVKAVAA